MPGMAVFIFWKREAMMLTFSNDFLGNIKAWPFAVFFFNFFSLKKFFFLEMSKRFFDVYFYSLHAIVVACACVREKEWELNR